jgi:GH24 family phage-related lysozyme (muramidase)
MGSAFNTDEGGLAIIKKFEGLAKVQPDGSIRSYKPIPGFYIDKNTGEKKPNSNWTVGYGQEHALFPGTLGEIPVNEHTVITKQQAEDGLRHFVANVVDPLVDKHFNPRTQQEHNALASWVYNIRMAKLERGEYSLPIFINAKIRDLDALIRKWLEYCQTPGAENGLYKRRIAEILHFFGLPWDEPAVWGFIRTAVWKPVPTPFDFIMAVAERAAMEMRPPEPEPLPAPPAPPVKVETPPMATPEAPNVDTSLPPKPMEESKTFNGLSKKESGQETVAVGGTLAGLAVFLPYIDAVTAYLSKYPATVIFSALGVVGVLTAGVGFWRWYAGRMIAFEGRQEAVQAKV